MKRIKRAATAVLWALVFATTALLVVPNASAAPPTHLNGSFSGISSVLVGFVLKGGKNYSTFADVFGFVGGLSGTCTGSDTSVVGLGPGNLSENGLAFIGDAGSCTLVGSVAGVDGSMVIDFRTDPGNTPPANDNFEFHFSGTDGTGGLASVHVTDGFTGPPGVSTYTALVQFG